MNIFYWKQTKFDKYRYDGAYGIFKVVDNQCIAVARLSKDLNAGWQCLSHCDLPCDFLSFTHLNDAKKAIESSLLSPGDEVLSSEDKLINLL